MLSLKSCEVSADGVVVATYNVTHAQASPANTAAGGTVTLHTSLEAASAMLTIDPAAAETEEEAFDRLADMLVSAATAIRARGEPKLGVPVYR